MTITVVNVRTAKQPFVYCGRRNARYGLPQSPLANPYQLEKGADRDKVLEQYRVWFYRQVEDGNKALLAELAHLKDKAAQGDLYLGCWCAPAKCHCDVIKSFVESHI